MEIESETVRRFNAELVRTTVRNLQGRSHKGRKMLRGIYFNLEKQKTDETLADILDIQKEIEQKLKQQLRED